MIDFINLFCPMGCMPKFRGKIREMLPKMLEDDKGNN
jgi:hypothetical protein